MTSTLTPPPKPRGLLKWAYLLPRSLDGWRLGWRLRHHIMMMTHVGRKTGIVRQSVVEAVNDDPKTQAGWGERTNRYRNREAHPALEIQGGSRRFVPQHRFLSTEELLALFQDDEHRHPRGLRLLFRHLGYPSDGSPEGLHAIAQAIRGVEFRPEAEKK